MARDKICIFCGKKDGPFHKEDILAKWMMRELPNKRPFTQVINKRTGKFFVTRSDLGLVTRAVCKACNGGWMSRLEGVARPIFQPMMRGKPQTLSADDQLILVRWLMKTAMVTEFGPNAIPIFFQSEDRREFFESFSIPDNTVMTLARWHRIHWEFRTRSHDIMGKYLVDGLSDYRAFITTFAIGQAVVQLFSVRRVAVPHAGLLSPLAHVGLPRQWMNADFQIWPYTQAIHFPPRLSLDDASFETFANRWKDFVWLPT
ncbi:MAG: hypothetical protein ACREFF_00500 [Candidatus Udaeobacter sp.]